MAEHAKRTFPFIATVLFTVFCGGCGPGVEKSPVFEGVDLKLVLIGSVRVGDIPSLESSASSVAGVRGAHSHVFIVWRFSDSQAVAQVGWRARAQVLGNPP